MCKCKNPCFKDPCYSTPTIPPRVIIRDISNPYLSIAFWMALFNRNKDGYK